MKAIACTLNCPSKLIMAQKYINGYEQLKNTEKTVRIWSFARLSMPIWVPAHRPYGEMIRCKIYLNTSYGSIIEWKASVAPDVEKLTVEN